MSVAQQLTVVLTATLASSRLRRLVLRSHPSSVPTPPKRLRRLEALRRVEALLRRAGSGCEGRIGTSGTPGAGLVLRSDPSSVALRRVEALLRRVVIATLAIVLKSIGVPLEGIGLVLGVERLLDMCRTVVNITGDASCAVVVASSEGKRAAEELKTENSRETDSTRD